MEKYICDNNNTLQPIEMWGRKYLRYIKGYHPVWHLTMFLSGKLNSHLAEIDYHTSEIFDRLIKRWHH